MPELPEVEAIRSELAPRVTGAKIRGIELILPRILREGDPIRLIGAVIAGIERQGKGMAIRLNRADSLFIHLRMTGTLLWADGENADRYARAVIHLDRGDLIYRDIRTLGGIWIRPKYSPPWKPMAPDPVSDEFAPALFAASVLSRRVPIKQALLDQSIVAGLGNIYAAEALFRARIHPAACSNGLTAAQLERLAGKCTEILREAIASKGTTFRDFRLSDGREGTFQSFLMVYGREGKACRVCSEPIHRIVQSSRSSFFCPNCQRLDS